MPIEQPGRAATYRRGFRLLWLALIVSILAALGTAGYTVRLQIRLAEADTRLQQAHSRVSLADSLVTDVRRAAADAQASLAVAMAPDVVTIELVGQPIAPEARGRALWSRGRGMLLAASHLPPLPAGTVYQVWLVTAQAPASAGLLTPAPDGTGSVFFASPPDIAAPVTVAVTLEHAGGVRVPTGPRYLLGTIGRF